jgi:phosphoribosylaminoimidazolecarboxamide formyltransferase/IMP cyclohydrolase
MSINSVEKIDDRVKVNHILISVSDKSGLSYFIPRLIELNPHIRIFSTGGTFNTIREFLKEKASAHLTQVSAYTGQPETQGGLVKTLDFKIYLGLLTETYNPAHQADLFRTQSVSIDMVVVNLYPFAQVISTPGVSIETARGNIDIGGPCMIRAAAKNFIRVASVVDPSDYPSIINEFESSGFTTNLNLRFRLAQKAFQHTAVYDRAIADHLLTRHPEEIHACYEILKQDQN